MPDPATADRAPAVSVVIPTHNRETRLAFALEALAAQTLSRERFEVIVVRSPTTAAPFATAPEGLQVGFLTAPEPSRPGQRNVGWRAARGELVAFTDDDCRPRPDWLERLLAAADAEPGALVQGRTEPDPDERHLLHGLARSVTVTGPSPWYPSCNIALPRDLLERLGGFDQAFEASGEDTDLALRALGAGAEARYADDAIVHHAVVPQPLPAAVGAGWRRWWTTPLLFKRHPGHRRHLYRGVFFNRSHAALAAAAAGAVLARRHPALLALAIPYGVLGIDPDSAGPRSVLRQALHMPSKAIAEGAVAAGLLRGAVRYRSLVI